MAEAFVHACQHGRTEVVRWFLDRGLNPDVAPYFGRTGLLGILSAVDGRDPVIRQLRKLIKPR
jgi:hypothetical protein